MDEDKATCILEKPSKVSWRQRFRNFIHEIKTLQGDPNYIAKGIAIGVFIGMTPTIPLHTGLAIMFAFIFKASKPAALIGAWSGNPVTVPFLYVGSFQLGMFLIGKKATFDISHMKIWELLQLGLDTFIAAILGGIIIGAPVAIAAYFISLKFFTAIRERKFL